MSSDDARAVADAILAKCDDIDDVHKQVAHYAFVVVFLVCHMAKQQHQDTTAAECAIRELYRVWTDMTVDEFRSPEPPHSVAH